MVLLNASVLLADDKQVAKIWRRYLEAASKRLEGLPSPAARRARRRAPTYQDGSSWAARRSDDSRRDARISRSSASTLCRERGGASARQRSSTSSMRSRSAALGPRVVLGDRLADDMALRLAETLRRPPDPPHGGVVQGAGDLHHTAAILPYLRAGGADLRPQAGLAGFSRVGCFMCVTPYSRRSIKLLINKVTLVML